MKNKICEICGKHAERLPMGCRHYPLPPNIESEMSEKKRTGISRILFLVRGWVFKWPLATLTKIFELSRKWAVKHG